MPTPQPTHLVRSLAAAALLALASCAAAPKTTSQVMTVDGHRRGVYDYLAEPIVLVDAHVGLRTFRTEADWEPTDDPLEFGLTFRTPIRGTRRFDWDLGLRYGFDRLERATEDFELQLFELNVGAALRLAPPGNQLQPYVGAGLALLFSDLERDPEGADATSTRDATYGPYARAGLQVEFAPAQLVGVEVRYIAAEDAEIDGFSRDTHATTVALTFGARF